MSCGCARWHKACAEAFDSALDARQLSAQLEHAALEYKFERASLLLDFPTPFTRRKCALIRHGAPMWLGPIDHEFIAPLRPAVVESLKRVDIAAWAYDLCPLAFQSSGGPEFEGGIAGVTYTSMASSGVTYSICFVRSSPDVSGQEQLALSMKLRCIGDMVKRAGRRIGLDSTAVFELTAREIDILKWTADGKCSHDVALILGISENTVNYHVKRVLGKIGCSSKLQAVAQAASCKLI
ncbi:Regulatory protein SdiA [Pseudomonas fluorescens]|nr:Regulatory protein SdiA [Pseudomonas fluorescens]CAG8871662.1 Regulatory protein SdiA [Pseudomonas fluorescens]